MMMLINRTKVPQLPIYVVRKIYSSNLFEEEGDVAKREELASEKYFLVGE